MPSMQSIRPAAVAGRLYPGAASELQASVHGLLGPAPAARGGPPQSPKMLVVPHGSQARSGNVAGRAFALLAPLRGRITRVVLVGPAHHAAWRGLAAPEATAFETPLGRVPVDHDGLARAAHLPQLHFSDDAHAQEHSIEVQLPFLQTVLGSGFSVLPLLVGDSSPQAVDEVLECLWGDEETLVIVSSGLSHHLPYAAARLHDQRTVQRVLAFSSNLQSDEACGAMPLNGALRVARRHGLLPRLLDLRSSADVAGESAQRVVGYCAVAFFAPRPVLMATDDTAHLAGAAP